MKKKKKTFIGEIKNSEQTLFNLCFARITLLNCWCLFIYFAHSAFDFPHFPHFSAFVVVMVYLCSIFTCVQCTHLCECECYQAIRYFQFVGLLLLFLLLLLKDDSLFFLIFDWLGSSVIRIWYGVCGLWMQKSVHCKMLHHLSDKHQTDIRLWMSMTVCVQIYVIIVWGR